MTDTIKEEMRRYRSLAVKVEENLRDRRLVKRIIQDKCVQANIVESVDKLKNIRYSSDSDVSSRDVASDTNNSESYSKMTIVEHSNNSESYSKMIVVEPMPQVAGEIRDNHDVLSPVLDEQHSQSQVCLTNNTVNDSKSIAPVTDPNKCVNAIEMATPNEDVTLPENWKPEVPRTLDIVPITLSNDEEDTSSSIGISKETENPPKLSRQGSYILDTPSPMLLAHMHTELTEENYVPTSSTDVSQRKQWNIAQPKVEWENKQFMEEDTEALSKLECIAKKSTSEHRESDSSIELNQTNKSTSCSKTVIVEENACRADTTPTKHNRRSNIDFKKPNSLEKSERDSDTSVLNLSSKEYTGDINGSKIQLSRIDEKQRDKKEGTAEYRNSNVKTKSSTPDKLLMVYKEIEEMHKKQMMELIYRQRKEQSLLQAEFQKQQMLLLAEIRKCASGTPRQANTSKAMLNRSLSSDETRSASTIGEARQQSNINSPGNVHAEAHCNIKLPLANRVIVCPLDYFSPRNVYLLKQQSFIADNSPATLDFDFTRKVSLCDTTYNNNNNNNNNSNNDDNSCESRDLIAYKNSNVSRQLFPLDSNTTNVPVLDTVYHDKHVSNFYIFNVMISNVL